jgi:RNA polymerase primary sigma factor
MSRSAVQSELQLYLREINGIPLLNPREERELGWQIVNDGCPESKDRMIRSNLRLVIAIAKNYSNRGLPLLDLIEEGNIGLIRAVEGFDPAQGARFSTYGSWWIKQSIKRMLVNASQPIHIPAYMVDLIGKWRHAAARLTEDLGRTPNNEEMGEALEVPLRKVHAIRRAMKAVSSSNQAPVGRDGEAADFAELCADSRNGQPEFSVERREDFDMILRLLESIDERDARVIRLRFGLEGQPPLTLKEIGLEVGLTRERVRQIEMEALRRLQTQMLDDRPGRFARPLPDAPSTSPVRIGRGRRASTG